MHDLRAKIPEEIQDEKEVDDYIHALIRDGKMAPLSEADRALWQLTAKIIHHHQDMSPRRSGRTTQTLF